MAGTPLQATLLVVVYTSDGYWIGADSARSSHGKRVETVCKVHETRFGLLLKSGASQGTTTAGETYSTDKEVETVLKVSTNAEEVKANLRSRFKEDIEEELTYFVNDLAVGSHQKLGESPIPTPIPDPLISALQRTVLLFEPDAANRLGEVLHVVPRSDPWADQITWPRMYRYWAPAILNWHPIDDLKPHTTDPSSGTTVTFPESVRMFGIPFQYTKPDEWVRSHPREALLDMLEEANRLEPEEVGPPYVIVHVTRGKGPAQQIQWI